MKYDLPEKYDLQNISKNILTDIGGNTKNFLT